MLPTSMISRRRSTELFRTRSWPWGGHAAPCLPSPRPAAPRSTHTLTPLTLMASRPRFLGPQRFSSSSSGVFIRSTAGGSRVPSPLSRCMDTGGVHGPGWAQSSPTTSVPSPPVEVALSTACRSLLRSTGCPAALGLMLAHLPYLASWAPACCSGQELLSWEPDAPESPWPPCSIPWDGRVGASLLTSKSLRMDTAQGRFLLQSGQVALPYGLTFSSSSSSASFCSMSSLAFSTSISMSACGAQPCVGCGLSSSPPRAGSTQPWLPALPVAPLAVGLYAASPSIPQPKGTNSCGCST